MTRIYSLCIIILLLLACTKPIELSDFDQVESKMVVNALFQADSLWKIQLSKLKSVTGPLRFEHVENPRVSIWRGNELICEPDTWISSGSALPFLSHVGACGFAQPGEIYSIEIEAPSFPSIVASDTLPSALRLEDYGFELIELREIPGNQARPVSYSFEAYLNVEIQDNVSEDEYYEFVISTEADYQRGQFGTVIDTIYRNPIGTEILDTKLQTELEIFSDESFDGEKKKLLFQLKGLIKRRTPPTMIQVEIRKVSRQYFLYHQRLLDHSLANQDPFSSPLKAYSNIEGGLGIWAGFHSTYLDISL